MNPRGIYHLLILHISCLFVSASFHQEKNRQLAAIEEAAVLLKSFGFEVENLCHPTSNEYDPAFPLCFTGSSTKQKLRGQRLLKSDELTSSDDSRNSRKRMKEIDVDLNEVESSWLLFYNILMSVACVAVSSVMAGLLMGLMTLDPINLHIIIRASADQKERQQAKALLPLVKQHHLILVSILLINCYAIEALPIFLNKLMPDYLAVIIGVVLVLLVGEIIPSAVFTGPNQIEIAGCLVPVVRLVIFVTYPLSYPISKVLDVMLHVEDEHNLYNRGELSALIRIQYEERMAWKRRRIKDRKSIPHATSSIGCIGSPELHSKHSSSDIGKLVLSYDTDEAKDSDDDLSDTVDSLNSIEVNVAQSALSMRTRTAREIYMPMHQVFAIPSDLVLNETNLATIYHQGFSRIPVYDGQANKAKSDTTSISGILLTKHLILVNRSDDRVVSTLPLFQPPCVAPDTNLIDLINMFQSGSVGGKGSHMAIVCRYPDVAEHALDNDKPIPWEAGVMGIITLEDVMEELLQQNILDEMDRNEREAMERARWAIARWKLFVQKRRIEREAAKLDNDVGKGSLERARWAIAKWKLFMKRRQVERQEDYVDEHLAPTMTRSSPRSEDTKCETGDDEEVGLSQMSPLLRKDERGMILNDSSMIKYGTVGATNY